MNARVQFRRREHRCSRRGRTPRHALASAVNSDTTPPVAASAPEAAGAGDHDAMRITIAGGGATSGEAEQVMAPRGNGHDNKAELLEIPAFLRRG